MKNFYNLSFPAFLTSWKEQNPERISYISGHPSLSPHLFILISYFFTFLPLHFTSFLILFSILSYKTYATRREERRGKEKKISPYLSQIWLSHGVLPYAMEVPGRRKEMRGKKRIGQLKMEEKEKMGKDERIYPLENI